MGIVHHFYTSPDQRILSKYGFKPTIESVKGVFSFQAEFKEPIVAMLHFTNGMICVDETYYFDKEPLNRLRLNRIWLENDNELDIILRQTFPSMAYEPKL